jgi:hypothetical protein
MQTILTALQPEQVRLVIKPEAAAYIRAAGGRLFIRVRSHGCCRGRLTLLEAVTEPPTGSERFWPIFLDGLTIFLDPLLCHLLDPERAPAEVQIELRGWLRRHIKAFWNGCVYVI